MSISHAQQTLLYHNLIILKTMNQQVNGSSKFCDQKVLAHKNSRNQKQQTKTLLQYLGKKPLPQKKDEIHVQQAAAAVKQFLSFFCDNHKNETTVGRSDEELYNEYNDLTMQFNCVGYKKPMFITEVMKLQDYIPENAMLLKREVNISVLTESLLGKRKRQ